MVKNTKKAEKTEKPAESVDPESAEEEINAEPNDDGFTDTIDPADATGDISEAPTSMEERMDAMEALLVKQAKIIQAQAESSEIAASQIAGLRDKLNISNMKPAFDPHDLEGKSSDIEMPKDFPLKLKTLEKVEFRYIDKKIVKNWFGTEQVESQREKGKMVTIPVPTSLGHRCRISRKGEYLYADIANFGWWDEAGNNHVGLHVIPKFDVKFKKAAAIKSTVEEMYGVTWVVHNYAEVADAIKHLCTWLDLQEKHNVEIIRQKQMQEYQAV